MLPGDDGACLLAAPLGGTGSAAVAAEFLAGEPVGAEVRELFSILTSHLSQFLAKARDYEQARTVALTLQHAILAPTELPHGFAARYTPAVPPLEVGGDWYDVVPLPGQLTGVVVGDCVGHGLAAANAFEHATGGRPADAAPVQITLTARATHAMVQLTVANTGTWRPPPADREHPAPGTRGHGLIFMHALMNEVTFDPSADGTTVTLTKDLKP